jgi:energy-coupling factor transporter ATP-binding protein EcfA2
MAQQPYIGSEWRHWDLHVHSPASYENSFPGVTEEEKWSNYLKALAVLKDVSVLGITDYYSLEGYLRVREAFDQGALPNIEYILPNIEMRLEIGTTENKSVNIHVITNPEIVQDLPSLLLGELTFAHKGESYTARREDMVRLGRTLKEDPSLPDRAAFNAGALQFRVSLKDLRTAFTSHRRLRRHALVAIPNSHRDGASGLREGGQQALRQELYRLADIMISSNPADRKHFLGCDGKLTPEEAIATYGKLIPCVGGSDAHDLQSIGNPDEGRRTWIKADPCFEGLLQICYEPAQRVRISDVRPGQPIHRIEQLRINIGDSVQVGAGEPTEAFCLRGVRQFAFSPGLTCVIGGRGAGKSTLLGLLEEAIRGGSEFFTKLSLFEDQKPLVVSQLIKVDLSSSASGVEFLRQNEIEQFALDEDKLTEAIFARLLKFDREGQLIGHLKELEDQLKHIDVQRTLCAELIEHRAEAKRLDAETEATARLVESLNDTTYTDLIATADDTNRTAAAIRRARLDLVKLIDALLDVVSTGDDDASHNIDADTTVQEAAAYRTRATSLRSSVIASVTAARAGEDLSQPSNREGQLRSELNALNERITAYLAERGISEENMRDLASASDTLASLNDQTAQIRKAITRSEEQYSEVSSRLKPTAREDFETALESLIDPINDQLQTAGSEELKRISIKYGFDLPAATDACIAWITEKASHLVDGRALRSDYVARLFANVDWSSLPALEDLIAAIDKEGEKTTAKQVVAFLQRPGSYDEFRLVVRRMIMDASTFKRLLIRYDDKPLVQASFGQRCSAALIILLMLGNTPIVIDEPEAHLDSALIANLLVALIKERKADRQIIFATHNANFVVNGDAELIHVLEVEGASPTQVTSTSLEDRTHREKVLRLEGGAEAFRSREQRYGFHDADAESFR